ncbi:MAG: hypothetical protein J5741_06460 [Bacteroidales bacterium]|nr:hypothetical protein [Bacteroidales bacterium]
MKKTILILLSWILCLPVLLQAQSVSVPYSLRSGERQQEKSDKPEHDYHFFVGGNINSNFGYRLALMAEGGIQFHDMFTLGVGPRYELEYSLYGSSPVNHCYGASAFGEVTLVDYLILHVGYEFLNYPYQDMNDGMMYRHNVHAFAAGIGFNSHALISDKLSIYAMYILYPYHSDRKFDYTIYRPFPMFARIGIRYSF